MFELSIQSENGSVLNFDITIGIMLNFEAKIHNGNEQFSY